MNDLLVLAGLALIGEPTSRTRLRELLTKAGVAATVAQLDASLARLRESAQLRDVMGRGFVPAPEAAWPAIRSVLDARQLPALRRAYLEQMPLRQGWDGQLLLRSYRQGVALLRMALIDGADPEQVHALLAACLACHEAGYLHPLVEICARPVDPELVARIHPALRAEVLAVLLDNAQREPAGAPAIRALVERIDAPPPQLRYCLAEHYLLCGRLDDSLRLVDGDTSPQAQYLAASVALLREDWQTGQAGHLAALKALRRASGKRKAAFAGLGGHLYVLSLLRGAQADDADVLLDSATRGVHNHDTPVYQQLHMLRQIRRGMVDVDVLPSRSWEAAPQAFMMRALLHFWLGLAQLGDKRAALEEACKQASAAGFDWIAAQLAALLGHLGSVAHERQATALRQQHRFADLSLWFEREEAWERQLNALINLQPATNTEVVREARLVWTLRFDTNYGVQEIEPREQKRDAQGGWSKGRAVSFKRLHDDAAQMDFLSAQDFNAIGAISSSRYYHYSGSRYELDLDKAVAALVGHPLLFWADAIGTRVELLPGEPELLVKARGGQVTISMQPDVNDTREDVCVTREAPNRLRVVAIKEEHRRVAAIVGAGLVVPLHAEQRVLKAISAVSSIVTVQSDLGASAADMAHMAADGRLHLHLLPYQQGLKMQVLVRPLHDAGAYYAPGSGAEIVIADLNGVRTAAKRDLNFEREAERQLVAHCPTLEQAEQDHGEWLLGHPVACLELLAELQALDAQRVLLAWPEGESFRVTKKVDSKSLRLAIKREKDWFAASGELQIAEDKVLDLRQLLEMMKSARGRFIALGEQHFLELSEELQRRLHELADYSEASGAGVRVHPLSSFALEDLAIAAGGAKTDKAWKEHLKRIAAQSEFQAQLPSTLQAELRDYQREGFEWLARLAEWGVGACLADDMGLGKTLQALALVLTRAPHGPTLVVAPTSVCLNWQSEAARFAPTLKVQVFGEGDRAAQIADAGPFDVLIVSYGLLQLEGHQFAQKRWHSIVLDEAQAIKNTATKRSQAVMGLQGDFRMVATGTPLENHLGELWNLFRFINPGLLGSLDQFNLRFAGPIERAQDKRAEAGARARLRRLIQPFILRRTKAQVLAELPARTEIVLPVDLTEAEMALYESLRRQALEKLAALEAPESQKAIQILAEMMKLRRACCNPELVAPELNLPSSKLMVFSRLVDELLENRHKVLVFSQFVDHLTLLRRHLEQRGIRYQYLDGSTPMQERKRRVDAFQGGEGDVFLISLKAGGVGINLTAADYVIHMDPWWNPAVEDQASDRAHRMGQLRPVTIYRLVAKHTIEEGIVDLHKHKRDLADSLLEGTDAAARMSPSDMLKMLREGLAK